MLAREHFLLFEPTVLFKMQGSDQGGERQPLQHQCDQDHGKTDQDDFRSEG